MKNFKDLKNEKQKRYNNAINDSGMFFAFSNEQFHKNKNPLKEGEKYVSIGGGGIISSGNLKQFNETTIAIEKWYTKAVREFKTDAIKYELLNHECYYTGDIETALSALGKGFTRKQVYEVYEVYRMELQYQEC